MYLNRKGFPWAFLLKQNSSKLPANQQQLGIMFQEKKYFLEGPCRHNGKIF